MKKKLTSLLALVFVLFVGVFASACGNKYKNFKFEIEYAFSEDAEEWYDGTNGISLNYSPNAVGGEDPSLIFDENGEMSLYVRINVKNVKSKHVDSITVSSTSVSGLNFISTNVDENEAFRIAITGNVNSTLKLYENNSNETLEIPFIVSRKLERVEADLSVNPAMICAKGVMSLVALNNLIYYPINQTNQIGVDYEAVEIGCFQEGTNTFYSSRYNYAEYVARFVKIQNGVLQIIDENFYSPEANTIKIKATSKFNPNIFTEFYVYVIEGAGEPIVQFDNNKVVEDQIHIYENGKIDANHDYSTSTILVPKKTSTINTYGGKLSYETVFYVKNGTSYVKYDFNSPNHQEGCNGLLIKDNTEAALTGNYTLSISNRLVKTNKIRIGYEVPGLSFSTGTKQGYKEISVIKGVLPTCISVNDAEDYVNGSTGNGIVYGTTSPNYKGLELKLGANPNDDPETKIVLEYAENELKILKSTGESVPSGSSVLTNESVFVRFADNASKTDSNLTIKTLRTPKVYNGENVVESNIVVTYNIKKLVTANAFEFLQTKNGNVIDNNSTKLLEVDSDTSVFVKVYHTGAINAESVSLKSSNENIKFVYKEGIPGSEVEKIASEITLDKYANVSQGIGFTVYEIPVLCGEKEMNGESITISAGEGTNVSSTLNVKVVSLFTAEINVDAGAKVRELDDSLINNGAFNFAIGKGDSETFKLAVNKGVADIQVDHLEGEDVIDVVKTSSSTFDVYANKGTTGTEKLKLTVFYYTVEDGAVVERCKDATIYIAVYDSIRSIVETRRTNNEIGYINSDFDEITSTKISFEARALYGSKPSESINIGGAVISGASKLKVEIETYIANAGCWEVTFDGKPLKRVDTIKASSGDIVVSLKGEVADAKYIKIVLTAVNFDVESNISYVINVPITPVDVAGKINAYGTNLEEYEGSSRLLKLSFMNVEDGGSVVKDFNATIEYDAPDVGNIRFDDIEKALTHRLYQYTTLDNDGNPKKGVKPSEIQPDFLSVEYKNGIVSVKAEKDYDGGWFKLVLVTKDSKTADPQYEYGYKTVCAIEVKVEDGINASYSIKEEKDFWLINNNLDKKFTLVNDIEIRNNFKPIGYKNDASATVNSFEGTLYGNGRTLTLAISNNNMAESSSYGDVFGLFAINKGTIQNLRVVVNYSGVFTHDNYKGLAIGSIVAVNQGTLDSVEVVVAENNGVAFELESTVASGEIYFGGIVARNEGTISSSKVLNPNNVKITSKSARVHNIGLIAGLNDSKINGEYAGKESLNNFVYDIYANLTVLNALDNASEPKYYIGSVAGTNSGEVGGILVGGQIGIYNKEEATSESGAIGGIVGSSASGSKISTSTAMALNINVTEDANIKHSKLNVGGIVGEADGTTIDYVKFVSVGVKHNNINTVGQIYGTALVGGIAGKTTAGKINKASVESFIDKVENKVKNINGTFYTINGGTTLGGLVAENGSTITNSFVNAHIASNGVIKLNGSYFVGEIGGNGSVTSSVDYSAIIDDKTINGNAIDWNGDDVDTTDGIIEVDSSVNAGTTDWTNIYTYNGTTYEKATTYTVTTYYKLNTTKWEAYANSLVSGKAGEWKLAANYNVATIDGVEVCLPYLVDSTYATSHVEHIIMIVKPQSISAEADTGFVTSINSIHVTEFDVLSYDISATIIVNYFTSDDSKVNKYTLVEHKNANGDTVNGLIDVSLIPEFAQGGFDYEILGDGYRYAYINSNKEIVFTGASGNTPILVRIYSVFSRHECFVVLYSQNLITELNITSNSVNQSFETGVDYEINLYTGQNNKIISFSGKNVKDGKEYANILNDKNASQYLSIETSIKDKNGNGLTIDASKLEIQESSYENITIRIKEDIASIDAEYFETVTFTLFMDEAYIKAGSTEKIELASVVLKAYLYNSAKNIDVDGGDLEKTTTDDIGFNVYLTTDYFNVAKGNETLVVNGNEISFDNDDDNDGNADRDGIKIRFDILSGEQEEKKLLQNVNKERVKQGLNTFTHFAQLFEENSSIISSLYKDGDGKTIGYKYVVLLELKDEHCYRYIKENIKFNLVVLATSNDEINTEEDPIEVLLKPTAVLTARMENYVVETLNVNTNYTDIVTNGNVETSIIEPGSLGNVMMIYLEPSYANVVTASIKSSAISVPSLGGNVVMRFTQIVYEEGANRFRTLINGNSQVGDTLELELVSKVDATGDRTYNGMIYLLVQLEDFTGVEKTITAELNVETSNGVEITRSRNLLTTYLPGTRISFDDNKRISETELVKEYLIQKGTSGNEVKITVNGYQFNSNPEISFAWSLPAGHSFTDVTDKSITKDGTTYHISNYVSYQLLKNYDEIDYDKNNDSYTLTLKVKVANDIPAAFKISATLSLTTKDGQLKTSKDNSIILHPTNYIVNSAYVNNLVNGRKNIAVGNASQVELMFTTDNKVNDLSTDIYKDLLEYAKTKVSQEKSLQQVLASMFSFSKNGEEISLDEEAKHPEFEFNVINNELISLAGLMTFRSNINFSIWTSYVKDGVDGLYKLNFGQDEPADKLRTDKVANCSFELQVYNVDKENEILVYDVTDIYNSSTGTWNLVENGKYVLLNDIVLENVVPITTPIASFDGNNRIIKIKSFKVDNAKSDYGLFASIGQYEVKDPDSEIVTTHQTILKNMIVDYSEFEGTVALNNLTATNVTFGGLVAKNNGGLIYNCDVMNLRSSTDAVIDVIVGSNANVTFGGLVGLNNGTITNSRVGRDRYTRITATKTTESSIERMAGGLTFNIFNINEDNSVNNKFSASVGGFVGVNQNGIIATSYVANTNLTNYSTHEVTNMTAGFVGSNAGKISFSYVKADSNSITLNSPRSTGYVVRNSGNGIVAGFVYSNTGNIDNAYANIELETKAAYISGFVYTNSGTITEAYSASTMNAEGLDSSAEQPFVGVDVEGNLLSFGKLENTYYLMRSSTDNPYKDPDLNLDYAQGLVASNFERSEYLLGFAFVLSNTKSERDQGIWSYYTLDGKKRALPELINADTVSHSYRYVVDDNATTKVLRNTIAYAEGTANNPYTISSVEEYNEIFTTYGLEKSFVGNVRFINNIDFNVNNTSIETRANFVLGSDEVSSRTSIEGNGMTIENIYLDVKDPSIQHVGLFAQIKNAYVKNLNLNFARPATEGGQFSTINAIYSGGLAGKIEDSVILNITLNGKDTTLTGANFVGGVAGLISGSSLVYGIETNLNIKANATSSPSPSVPSLYYNETDFVALNIQYYGGYESYIKNLSYAGSVAGVLDLTKKSNVEYNIQYVDVRGDLMSVKASENEANILAEYAGGIAGYASDETSGYRLRYFVGTNDVIQGDIAVGGLYAVSLGSLTASQVTAEEEVQYKYDTKIGEYVLDLFNKGTMTGVDKSQSGNLGLLKGSNFVGGLVGIGLQTDIRACYAKVGIVSGVEIGGLIGMSVASEVAYSYAIPYIAYNEKVQYVGGLIGSAYSVLTRPQERNKNIQEYEALLKYKGTISADTDIKFTYSTLIMDLETIKSYVTLIETNKNIKPIILDYVSANYMDKSNSYLYSNSNSILSFVYAGPINYTINAVSNTTKDNGGSSIVDLYRLYRVGEPDQTMAFNEVFSGWSVVQYWSLDETKYFPLLINDVAKNYIEIDDESDLSLIKNNPDANFRIVKDIVINDDKNVKSNWIIDKLFRGTITGKIEGTTRSPRITIKGMQPKSDGTTGFFKQTEGAQISNLIIEWEGASAGDPGFDLSKGKAISTLSGFICEDEGSLISSVEVRTSGYIVNDTTNPIGGFGGIVGDATNTNLMGVTFVGKVKAKLQSSTGIYFGGLVASAQTINGDKPGLVAAADANNQEAVNKKSMVISNSRVGVKDSVGEGFAYPTTSFDLMLAQGGANSAYLGGAVGQAINIGISGTHVAGINYQNNSYKQIDFTINQETEKIDKHLYMGGLFGFAQDGTITNNDVSTNIKVVGETGTFKTITQDGEIETHPMIRIAGIAGEYRFSLGGETAGISKTHVVANIETHGYKTTESTQTFISTGVAVMSGGATLKQCLISGEINTEHSDTSIAILYVGGAVAMDSSTASSPIDIEEITTNTIMYVGSTGTKQLYVGGLIGLANSATISYSASWGRIVPITSSELNGSNDCAYAGGLIGLIVSKDNKTNVKVNNSYTISNIIADSIAGTALKDLNMSALVGKIPDAGNNNDIVVDFENVFYSSDLGLFADENYVKGAPLGTNLSAQTLMYSSDWQNNIKTENGETNAIWSTILVDGVARVPHLTALEYTLKDCGYLKAAGGSTVYDFVEGTAMKPITIGSANYTFDKDNYTYYLLTVNRNNNQKLPSLNGALNGVLIGEDVAIDSTFVYSGLGYVSQDNANGIDKNYCGIIPAVLKHSVVSNFNVVLPQGETINMGTETSGVIAGLNNGVIFNSSVQGKGVTFEGGSQIGLIASSNRGLVSYCYSTAEIISSENAVGGIVNVNGEGGKLLSNYFTGYLEGKSSAGVVVEFANDNNYAYNNYMAGVVPHIGTGNAFIANTVNIADKFGNNYIDSYSDVNYASLNNIEGLNFVSTAQLMTGDWDKDHEDVGLNGEWITTVSIGGAFDQKAQTFGYNYNYPVYKFNKKVATATGVPIEEYVVRDWKNQVYTGTGVPIKVVDAAGNVIEDVSTLESRAALLHGETQNYKDAFKIPHLGVLSATHNLMTESRNYVIIYDINGLYQTEKHVVWESVGVDDKVNGFEKSTDKFGSHVGANGVFVANKYFLVTDVDNSACTVTNISNEGLFTNLQDAYIENIKLGNFSELNASGALAASVVGNVTVNNIAFEKESVVSGKEKGANYYYGGLFGSISTGEVKIQLFKSAYLPDGGSSNVPAVKLKGTEETTVGLIAGKLLDGGSINLVSGLESSYYAWFEHNNYAGGLVGETGGTGNVTIDVNSYVVNLVQTQIDAVIESYTNVVGGIVGKASNVTIYDAVLNLYNPSTNESAVTVTLQANAFGGIAGEATGLTANIFTIQCSEEFKEDETYPQVNLVGDAEEDRYYGLIAGKQAGAITVESFKNTGVAVGTYAIQRLSVSGASVDDETKSGVGTFVGCQDVNSASLNVLFDSFVGKIFINSMMIPNLGGFVGYGEGGTTHNINGENLSVQLTGTKNVGGLIGYYKGTVTEEMFTSTWLERNKTFAHINVVSGENFGGMFGKWEGSNYNDGSYTTISNINSICNNYSGIAKNVGGVVGKLILCEGGAANLTNRGGFDIAKGMENVFGTEKIISDGIIEGKYFDISKLINVGGVIGSVEYEAGKEDLPLKQLKNAEGIKVFGYQNVGGLIGYLGNGVSLVNDECGSNLGYNNDEGFTGVTAISFANANKGNVYGVINVGGAVGCAASGSSISQILNNVDVYGNANVGGLVGYANGATIKNNLVQGKGEFKQTPDPVATPPVEIKFGSVNGVYHESVIENGKEYKSLAYIPTSIGGLVGKTKDVLIKNNVLNSVNVLTTIEGSVKSVLGKDLSVISTNKNYMVKDATDKIYIIDGSDDQYIDFDEIKSGVGGLVGTVDFPTFIPTEDGESLAIISNSIVNLNIEASLGVNVGTYYGAVSTNGTNIEIDSKNRIVVTPTLYGDILVDGAYQIGGIVGLIDASTMSDNAFNLDNEYLKGAAKIVLQSRITGLYVGGLVGKTNKNKIEALSYYSKTPDPKDVAKTNDVAITMEIYTSNCYYAGGLIGVAEVKGSTDFKLLELGYWQTNDNGTPDKLDDDKYEMLPNSDKIVNDKHNDKENFGALIGALQVVQSTITDIHGAKSGYLIKVDGSHEKAFTINAINSENYYDGEARLSYDDKEKIELRAEAYYINQDSFKIAGSKDETLYDNDGDRNPLNQYAQGWSKQYTGFRKLGRIIPAGNGNGQNPGENDAILLLYDAEKINHVGTIGNLGLYKDDNSDGLNDNTFRTKDGADKQLPADHICFTVYEQMEGLATLYSAVGIASVVYNYDKDDPKTANIDESKATYAVPRNNFADVGDWALSLITQLPPNQFFYIDANREPGSNSYYNNPLTYFEWGDETSNWKKYNILNIEYNKDDDKTSTSIQDSVQKNGNEKTGDVKAMTYFVPNYLSGDPQMAGDVTHEYAGETKGAYFVFDVIYENSSMNGLKYEGSNEFEYNLDEKKCLPKSGSILDVSGVFTTEGETFKENGKNDFTEYVFWATLAIEAAAIIASMGLGGGLAAAIKEGIAQAGVGALKRTLIKKAVAAFGRHVGKSLLKNLGKNLLITGALILVNVGTNMLIEMVADANSSYLAFVQPSTKNYGYASSVYSREIWFKKSADGKVYMLPETDSAHVTEAGDTYLYYSGTRPNDFYSSRYLAMEIEIDKDATKTENGNITQTTITRFLAYDDPNYKKEAVQPSSRVDFVKVYDNVTYHDPGESAGTSDDVDVKIILGEKSDGSYWILYEKYKYIDGTYYIHELAGKVEYIRTTLDFKPEEGDFGGVIQELETPNYIDANGSIYVHGKYKGDGTYVYDNSYPGNNLIYSDGKYKINDVEYNSDVVVETVELNYIPTDNGTYADHELLGYYRFDGAYYAHGNGINPGIVQDGTELVKFAKFEYNSTASGLNDVNTNLGTKGVDYVVKAYTQAKQSNTGNWLKVGNQYIDITTRTKYVDNGNGTFSEDPNGTHIYVGGKHVPIDSANRYSDYVSECGFFTISNTTATGPATDLSQTIADRSTITLPIYPYSFTNPYTKVTINSSWYDGTDWYYTPNKEGLSTKVDYYLYEGGYVAADYAAEPYEGTPVFLPVSKSVIGETFDEDGNITEYKEIKICPITNFEDANKGGAELDLKESEYSDVGFDEIIKYWETGNKYMEWYSKEYGPLFDVFNVKNGVLFMNNASYALNEDGLLARARIKLNEDDDPSSVYSNLFLSNKDYGIYTRYRYIINDLVYDMSGKPKTSDWSKYSLTPEKGTMINKGKFTKLIESAKVCLNSNGYTFVVEGSDYSISGEGAIDIT